MQISLTNSQSEIVLEPQAHAEAMQVALPRHREIAMREPARVCFMRSLANRIVSRFEAAGCRMEH